MTRRETVLGCVVAAALIVATTFFGPPSTPEPSEPSTRPRFDVRRDDGARRAGVERSSAIKPTDPIGAEASRAEERRPLAPAPETRRAPPPAPPPPTDVRVRVVDPAGGPVAGVAVVLTDAPFDDPKRRVVAGPVESNASGEASLPRPEALDVERLHVYASTLGFEPRGAKASADPREATRVVVPERGVVDVFVVDEDDRPVERDVRVDVLVGTRDPAKAADDPWVASLIVRRGAARLRDVEVGALLLIEARVGRADFRAPPLVIEGPAEDGGVVKATLRLSPREAASARVVERAAKNGPPPSGLSRAPKDGERRAILRHDDLVEKIAWPYALEVAVFPEGEADAAPIARARADDKGVVKLLLKSGRYELRRTLFRARPFGWSAVVVDEATTPTFEIADSDVDFSPRIDLAATSLAIAELLAF
jgi:hypothetical protein